MKILFICKHNVFRSRVAEILFKRMNKNKKYSADSAGIIMWTKKEIENNAGYHAEKKIARNYGINLVVKPKSVNSKLLKETDVAVIVADDVPKNLIETERFFRGKKILVWKIRDVKSADKSKEKIARKAIESINKKIKDFVISLE